jgi:hypothetical protein
MYVILMLAAVLLVGLLSLAAYLINTVRTTRKRQAVADRLAAVVAQAEEEHRARNAAAKASTALTAVLPAIADGERGPRRVA